MATELPDGISTLMTALEGDHIINIVHMLSLLNTARLI